ncbi:ParB/RepB/Spo0J family partition protein [Ornithinimicrobium tianjinense]|uniref:ParB-like N-terminal domain-containing protein n=1 Tax=Ornithinimicrobium tianjinense TaxID=1195761 RepID=A0A917BQK4_9MICO|nr:ParB/RepB/Spo0J family partition protein [Ornithinimicrobium tianjinense]GGF53038.1 hypothetical protein GCM10011366_21000 [Ornithinimicrobium tianjinense]
MSSDRRRGLGKGLGALIPSGAPVDRPADVFFPRVNEGFTGNNDGGATVIGSGFTGNGEEADTPTGTDHGTDRSTDRETGGERGPVLAPVPGADFAEIPLDAIRPNPRQPRQVFDEDDLAELVASITELGVLQPVVVRPVPADDRDEAGAAFELVMGERRLRASKQAGQKTIPAIVRSTDDENMLRDALLENLHRAQLNPLEEAAAYQQMLEDFGCTHEHLATRIGRSRPQISNTIRLLKLPPLVQRRVASGVLSAGHARALLGLADGAAMERLAQRIVAEGLSVRSVEEIVMLGGDGEPTSRKSRQRQEPSPELQRVASTLSERLETRVQVMMGRNKGRLTVDFADQEDLERILDALSRS